MKNFIKLFALMFLLGFGVGCETTDPATKIDGPAARELVSDGAVLLDVRTRGEYKRQNIPQAKNIPIGELSSRLDELPDDKSHPIVVHCQSGNRSATAVKVLNDAGYTNVKDLGGIGDW